MVRIPSVVFEESSSDSESDGFHALAHRARVRLSKRPRQEIVAYSAVPGEFSSDTESDEVQTLAARARAKMSEKEASSSGVISEFQKVKEAVGRQVIMSPEGMWCDSKSFFIVKAPLVEEKSFYTNMAGFYRSKHPGGPLAPYDEGDFDHRFRLLSVARAPFPLRDHIKEMPEDVADKMIRAAFQLPSDVEWRWPEPGERIYHRPADGFVPVWMEHLRSGWNPRWHVFFKHLCKYEFKCSPMQLTPNAIKWMTWFLAACNKKNYYPTLKLFHMLFQFKKSGVKPLYELRFRSKELGLGAGFVSPVMHQSSLKGWNGEVLMLKGLDLAFMPYIVSDEKQVRTDFGAPGAAGAFREQLREFCGCLGSQLTRDLFMQHDKLHGYGCK
ncbi:uncharacterized protein LOC108204282 isoform X1 [Daucus carota subsp. sativus]|uniref:uncharacterized protein LOC108204282 isoform X1 n=1 Tax=Daucus carota subsp. sativus TaxID=79200 RepID=UPI003083CA2B